MRRPCISFGKRPLMVLAACIIFLLPGCRSVSQGFASTEAVSLPPEVGDPLIAQSEPGQTATIEPVKNGAMPTAIARMIGVVLAKSEATASATAVILPAPSPTPAPTPCNSPGKIVTGTYPSEAAGTSAYRIYLPPCYEPDGPSYPTLYMLPGNIHSDGIWDALGLDEAAEEAITGGEIPPLLIVMADSGALLNNTSGGPWSYETQILEDLIPFIESNYCAWGDPQGRAIGGMSRGGYWSLEIAFRHPEMFASVGGHSAALLDLYGGPDVIPQSTGLANDLGSLRLYFDIGEDDWVITNIRQLHEDMTAAGIKHEWVLNEGKHEDAYWSSHTSEYLAWYAEPWSLNRGSYPQCLK